LRKSEKWCNNCICKIHLTFSLALKSPQTSLCLFVVCPEIFTQPKYPSLYFKIEIKRTCSKKVFSSVLVQWLDKIFTKWKQVGEKGIKTEEIKNTSFFTRENVLYLIYRWVQKNYTFCWFSAFVGLMNMPHNTKTQFSKQLHDWQQNT
jgi:hypothetical protein